MVELLLNNSDILVVRIDGILSYPTADYLQQELTQALSTHKGSKLRIDMANVQFMDSAGLFSLFHVLSLANQLEKGLILCCVPPGVELLLRITGLEQSFELSDSLFPHGHDAIESQR